MNKAVHETRENVLRVKLFSGRVYAFVTGWDRKGFGFLFVKAFPIGVQTWLLWAGIRGFHVNDLIDLLCIEYICKVVCLQNMSIACAHSCSGHQPEEIFHIHTSALEDDRVRNGTNDGQSLLPLEPRRMANITMLHNGCAACFEWWNQIRWMKQFHKGIGKSWCENGKHIWNTSERTNRERAESC